MRLNRTALTAALIAAIVAPAANAGWTQHVGPVLVADQVWEQTNVQEPSVVYNASSHTFQMWYTGADEGKCMIGYATSTDGLTWTKPVDHPVIGWGYGGVPMNACHSNIQKLGGTYYAWFSIDSAYYNPAKNGNLYAATSPDGINWKPLPKPAIRAGKTGWNTFIANSFVLRDHGRWVMFWESFGQGLWRLSTATSSDLIHWKPAAKPALVGLGFGDTFGGPSIIRDGNHWTMYLHAWDPAHQPVPPMFSLIYQATSTDLTHWATTATPLVVQQQPDWQVDQIADPSVVTVDGHRMMFFDGLNNAWPIRSSIGVAVLG